MTTVLLATASVHTSAAACDHLSGQLGADDCLLVLGVVGAGSTERDVDDAANVARSRLVEPMVETLTREPTPAAAISTVADEYDVDVIVVGATRGDPETAGNPPGSTVTALLSTGRWPITVLPPPAP